MEHQLPVLNDPARFKVAVCGRRWGKTALGLISTTVGHGDGKRRGALQGGKVWWVAPDYPTAEEIWRDLKRLCKPIQSHKDETERRIELVTGGSVTVKSAHDPESLVGVGNDGVVIDEAAKVHPDAWYRSLRPTLSDTGGWAVFIGTPNGYNWLHDIFEHAATEPGWARWQLPTSQNPLVPQSELDAAQRDSPAFFGQEYLAQFTSIEGAVFPPDWFDGILFDQWPDELPTKVMALDPSMGKGGRQGDYSAIISLGMTRDKMLWVDADMGIRDTIKIVRDSLRIYEAFGAQMFGIEVNGFQQLLAADISRVAREMGLVSLPIDPIDSSINKEVRIQQLGNLFATRRIKIKNTPGGRLGLAQLRDFRLPPHPAGYHDDFPDGLHMAVGTLIRLLRGRNATKGPKVLTV